MPNPTRSVHPGIADPVPGAALHGTAPKLQYADGLWNNGEGFELAPVTPDADTGGWFDHDAGLGLTAADINLDQGGWVLQPYGNPLRLSTGTQAERVSGYLRPAGLPLPTWHPRYGNVGPYVDQGAFEIFRPLGVPYSGQKVLIVIRCFATVQFPGVYDPALPMGQRRSVNWYNTYRGYFSPDGLVRDEFASVVTGNPVVDFQQNTDDDEVGRFLPDIIASWYFSSDQSVYYPIEAYPVLTVPGRQTELNEQRYLQMVQALMLLLLESTWRNPLGATNALTAQQIEDEVVVVFDGGSNGGTQSWEV
ncbi:MAG: hypothetical protein KDC98_25530 [Planctomycetes bacterium]|nr:hypothetical protein [Planctomycetota bacterium]